MSSDNHLLRRVDWTAIFPWLMIMRVFRLSISAPLLLLATAGVLLTPLGWRVAGQLVSIDERQLAEFAPAVASGLAWPEGHLLEQVHQPAARGMPGSWAEFVAPMAEPIRQAVWPFHQLFQRDTTARQFIYCLVGGLWMLLVWSLIGGAITRVAVVRLGREEREGLHEAVRFAAGRFLSYFGAPLFSLSGVALVAIFGALVGLTLRFDAGVVLGGLVWMLVLLGGLLATILLLGLLFGWPLMWAAISAEEMGDVFEAAQRGYSYTFGRPLHYLFYAVVALLLGAAGLLLVEYFAMAVIELSYWSVSWGAGEARLRQISTSPSGWTILGNTVIQTLNALVLTVASAYRYSYFWCAAAAIYLLLRRDVDRTDLDDIYVLDEQQKFGLPPLATDEAGVPGVPPDAEE
jgi:hypothetical protein